MIRWIVKLIYFKILGWKILGNKTFSKNEIDKAVVIAIPHTSWHDFFVGIYLRKVVDVKVHFVAKKELFSWPMGVYFRSVGGRSIDRTAKQNKVDSIAKLFENEKEFRLCLAPEGTRKKVQNWKTGFYYIAKKANVPIIMFTLDYENKENRISEPFYPTDDKEADFKFMKEFYRGVKGKIPKYS